MPVSLGALTFVIPSPLAPESSAASSAGAGGCAGAVVSIVSEKAGLAALTLPAASVAVAVTLYVPSAKGEASVLKTEAELGGNVGDARFADGKLFFDLATASADRIVALDVADKSVATITELKPYQGGGLAVDAETHTLCIGDRTKGLRLFALDTFKEKDSAAIDLGLLPADLAVIR